MRISEPIGNRMWESRNRGIMNIEQLRYAASLSSTRSLSESAKEQFVSRQAISKAIRSLERELGSNLFDRTDGLFVPNDLCKALSPRIDRVLADLDAMKMLASASRGDALMPSKVVMGIGCTPFGGREIPDQVVAEVTAEHPLTEFHIVQMTHGSCILRTLQGDFDLCIVGGVPAEEGFSSFPLTTRAVCVAMDCGHQLVSRKAVSLEDICPFPVARPFDLGCFYDELAAMCKSRGLPELQFVNGPLGHDETHRFLSDGGLLFVGSGWETMDSLPRNAEVKEVVSGDFPLLTTSLFCKKPESQEEGGWQSVLVRSFSQRLAQVSS